MTYLQNLPTRWLARAGVSITAGVAVALLAGCSGGGDHAGHQAPPDAATPTSSASAPASASASGSASVSAEHNDADLMFAEMMIPHHQQAIEMSDMILAKDGIDPEVRQLAEQIKAAQQPEIDTMRAWIETWGPMADHENMEHGDDDMGMMTPEELQALDAADAAEGQRMFLEGMIEHHKGAIAMARTEIAEGENPQAVEMANSIITSQQAEITQMELILERLG